MNATCKCSADSFCCIGVCKRGDVFNVRASGRHTHKHKSKEQKKVHTVMSEFKRGKLKSNSGKKVTKRKQAVAIGLSEAGLSKKK